MQRKLTRNKKCKSKECDKRFDQVRFGQVTCDLDCAIDYAKQQREAKQKKANKEFKKKIKEKHKTISQYKKDLEKEINLIVRLIDKDHPCMMCDNPNMKRVNACHHHGVGSNDTIRFNLFNIWAGCHKCNGEMGGNINGYDEMLIKRQGRERWEYVKFDLVRTYKHLGLTIPEIKELTLEARKIAKELKSINMTYSDSMRWKLREKLNKRLGIYK